MYYTDHERCRWSMNVKKSWKWYPSCKKPCRHHHKSKKRSKAEELRGKVYWKKEKKRKKKRKEKAGKKKERPNSPVPTPNYFFTALNWALKFPFSVCIEFSSSRSAIRWDCSDVRIASTSSCASSNAFFTSCNCVSYCFRIISGACAASSASANARALRVLLASVSCWHVCACSAARLSSSRLSAVIRSIVSCNNCNSSCLSEWIRVPWAIHIQIKNPRNENTHWADCLAVIDIFLSSKSRVCFWYASSAWVPSCANFCARSAFFFSRSWACANRNKRSISALSSFIRAWTRDANASMVNGAGRPLVPGLDERGLAVPFCRVS